MCIVAHQTVPHGNQILHQHRGWHGTGATFTIPATAFTDDDGNVVTTFPTSFAYYNLYINAMILPGNASTLAAV